MLHLPALLALTIAHVGAQPLTARAPRVLNDCSGDSQIPTLLNGDFFIFTCAPRNNYALFASISDNINMRRMELFVAAGPDCTSPAWDPTATNPYQYEASSGPSTDNGFFLSAFCANQVCCAMIVCLDANGCEATTLSLQYTPPTTGTCALNNQAGEVAFPPGTTTGNALTIGATCAGVAGSTTALTLSNPNNALLTVVAGDGQLCSGPFVNYDQAVAPATLPAGVVARASAVRTRSPSILFSGTPCATEPCCALVWCHWDGGAANPGGCAGLRYSYAATPPPAASPAAAAPQLTVGAAIAIGVGLCLFVVLAVAAAVRYGFISLSCTPRNANADPLLAATAVKNPARQAWEAQPPSAAAAPSV